MHETAHRPDPHGLVNRRRLVTLAGVTALSAGAVQAAGIAGAGELSGIVQPAEASGAAFIGRAFEMRHAAVEQGDQPYGAVVVRDSRIIGQSPSRVVTGVDPTAHAELAAIRDAARRTGSRDLSGATLYSSSRPCPMCEAAAYWARIERMIHGRAASDAGPPRLCR